MAATRSGVMFDGAFIDFCDTVSFDLLLRLSPQPQLGNYSQLWKVAQSTFGRLNVMKLSVSEMQKLKCKEWF